MIRGDFNPLIVKQARIREYQRKLACKVEKLSMCESLEGKKARRCWFM